MLKQRLIDAVTYLGFDEWREIKAEEIVFDSVVFDQCARNTCGKFGANHSCPPMAGTFEDRKSKVLNYRQALLLNKIISISSRKALTESREALAKAIKEMRKEFSNDDVLILGAGACTVCENCTAPEGLPCRFPDQTQYSMEGSGIDVVRMSLNQKMTYNAGKGNLGFFTLVLY
jgi:predicted metal-binding protein